ncbi:hypothetical protein Tco_1173782 [Tanacetum coccineum]
MLALKLGRWDWCERKEYARTLPLCNKCKLHHNGPCTGTTGVNTRSKKEPEPWIQAEGVLEQVDWCMP